MEPIKKILGIIWALLGPGVIILMIIQASRELSVEKPAPDAKIFWAVIITIFIPIAIGLTIFGLYALQSEYDRTQVYGRDGNNTLGGSGLS